MNDDFGHRIPLNQIRDGERIDLTADESERTRVAERLGLEGLERFEAHATLARTGDIIRAKGRLRATLTQSCVATGDPIVTHSDEPFDLIFMPEPAVAGDEEIELGTPDLDIVFHDGSAIDLGDAITDTLGLGLDPYPRSAGADAALKEAGVLNEAETGPFAALARLKRSDSEKP